MIKNTDKSENIFVARQAIYDSNQKIYGYELLYRDGEKNKSDIPNKKLAYSEVITNIFLNIGIDTLVGSANAFINITEEFILDDSLVPMYAEQTVLVAVKLDNPSNAIYTGLKRLKELGYKIALDDFKCDKKTERFLELADIVKIDVLKHTETEIEQQLKIISNYDVLTIAERIETHASYKFCELAGFDYFQGYYLSKPQVVEKKHFPPNKVVVLSLLAKLLEPSARFDEISKLLAHDANLTYKLLRYVNSASFSNRKEIESIEEALMIVGAATLKKWASLMLMLNLAEGKPQSLLVIALIRARMCELLAPSYNLDPSQMFTTGLLSVLDTLLDTPMENLLDNLPVITPIKLALLEYAGPQGELLHNVIFYEKADWLELISRGGNAGMYYDHYIDAVKWADKTTSELLE